MTEEAAPAGWQAGIDEAAVGVLAFLGSRGQPLAWTVTPYRVGDRLVITSTLAYPSKAAHIRRDSRVAVLAGGWHLQGDAEVRADLLGRRFTGRLLDQELRKYPPARAYVRAPLHRALHWWYFGRVLMLLRPATVERRAGGDRATVTFVDQSGYPRILPIEAPEDLSGESFALRPLDRTARPPRDGAGVVLVHEEHDAMRDLRQLTLRGRVADGRFVVRSRRGSLDAPAAPRQGAVERWRDQVQTAASMHARGWRSLREIRGWEADP